MKKMYLINMVAATIFCLSFFYVKEEKQCIVKCCVKKPALQIKETGQRNAENNRLFLYDGFIKI